LRTTQWWRITALAISAADTAVTVLGMRYA
jgi:hypothetical protein